MSAPGNTRLVAAVCAGAATAMLGLAFASEPLYRTFCQVTGFGGTTQRAEVADDDVTVLDREVTVRFDANVAPGVPLEFAPAERSTRVHVGANSLAFYSITNTSDRPLDIVATYNVAPHRAGPYFVKLECFCFNETRVAPGETRELPVVFFVHSAIDEDEGVDDITTITLSYTFFEARGETAGAANEDNVR